MNEQLSFYIQKYFLSYLIAQRGYGDNTAASYRDTFRMFLAYLEKEGHKTSNVKLAVVDRECVQGFLEWLGTERQNGVSTKNVRLAHLKSFYGYVMTISPEFSQYCSMIMSIPFGKAPKKPPAYMTEAETAHLLDAPDKETREGLRHLAILSLLYDSGCRVQELIELNVGDVAMGKCCRIFVHGKGDKYREIPVLGKTGKILQKYVGAYGLNQQDILFSNKQGNRLTRAGISYIMNKYKSIVNSQLPNKLPEKISPHLMRHSKSTHLINAGVNIYNIRDFLGHASVTTTQVYLTSNPEATRKAIEKVSQETVPESTNYYSERVKSELMEFLESLV